MKYKSNLVAQASGALGGKVASRNKGGDYFRRRALPTNPRTPLQVQIRSIFGTLSQYYGQRLTDAQRAGWTIYGQNVPLRDRLGDPRPQSGIAAYLRSNTPRVLADNSIINDAPKIFSLGITPSYNVGVVGNAPNRNLSFSLLNIDQYSPDDSIFVFVGRPQGPGIAFFKGPYRFAVSSAGDVAPISLPLADSPYVYSPGQRIFVRLTVSMEDGRYSTPADMSCLYTTTTTTNAIEGDEAAAAAAADAPAAVKEKRARRAR